MKRRWFRLDRRRLLGAVGAAVGGGALAGCLAGQRTADDSHASRSPTAPRTTPSSRSGTTPTAGSRSFTAAANEPDPDVAVVVENRHDAAHALSVTVTSESGEVVHRATHEVAAGARREVYNLRSADPDGVEAFTVEVALDGRTESVDARTSACYGDVFASVTEEGELFLTYSVC